MTDIKFELERSSYFNKRSQILASNGVPKLSDAKENLGDTLAKVVFEQCDEALKEDFGLKLPLNGPGDMLWVSPSDLLIGKIALKPPFTPKCLQALTHEGILQIGEGLEKRFRNEIELDKQKTLDKYKAELLANIEDRMKSEIKDVEIRERLACRIEMENLQLEFDLILKNELDKLEIKIRQQYEDILCKNQDNLTKQWEKKMREEVRYTVQNMTREFLAQLEEQEQKLTNAFELELRKKEILREFDLKLHKTKLNDALRTLKQSLECKNLVNMMFLLCTERRKCCESKQAIETHYQKIICDLEDNVVKKENKIKKLIMEKETQIKEVHLRETFLKEVIRNFQKFINFALRAAPTQAEFLLSVEKMMAFELASTVAQSEFPRAQEEPFIIPWNNRSTIKAPSVSSSLEISDYHNCLNELNPPTPRYGSEIGEDGVLPAMYFNNKMYVREDFRDMLATGVKISPSNEIWSQEVEILIQHWRKQSNEVVLQTDRDEKLKEEVVKRTRDDGLSISNADRRRSKQSTVQFSESGIESVRTSKESIRPSRKSSMRPSFPVVAMEHIQAINSATSSLTNILAAKDSLEVIIEQKQKSGIFLLASVNEESMDDISCTLSEEVKPTSPDTGSRKSKELVVETRDSVILRKSSIARRQSSAEFTVLPKDSIEVAKETVDKGYEVRSKPSKLVSARNSLELLKESLSKLKEPAAICQRKGQQQNTQNNAIPGFAETCCEHCKRKDSLSLDEHSHASRLFKRDSFSDEKSVKISRVQIINLEDENIIVPSIVSFDTEPKIFDTPISASDSCDEQKTVKRIYRKKKRRGTPKRIELKLKVVGDQQAKEGDQSNDEFTADRIHSLINLMKDNPHLLQLFTAGSR